MTRGRVAFPVKLPSKINKDVAYLLGVLHGDGCITKRSFEVKVNLKDYNYVKCLVNILKKFDLDPKVYKEFNCYRISVNSVIFKNYLNSYGPNKCENWKVPQNILDSNYKIKAAYLRGLFDTDGTVTMNLKRQTKRLALYSKNKNALRDIKKILKMDFSIDGYITKSEKTCKNVLYTWYVLSITNQLLIKRFSREINFNHPRKKRKLREVIKSYHGVQEKYYNAKEIIIAFLNTDGRLNTKDLTKSLKRTDSTIREHLNSLLKERVIKRDIEFFNRYGKCEKSRYKKYFWSINGAKNEC
jgi:intein/homing endonuclease